MRILITGGLGVIGARVARKLVARGDDPILYENRADFSLAPDLEGQVPFVQGDVCDFNALTRAMTRHRVERVVHAAAIMPPPAQANPSLGLQINVLGTVQVLEAARLGGINRVVFTSSKAAYGHVSGLHGSPTYLPVIESVPLKPVTVYDVTKAASEGMGSNYQRNYGIEFVALRFATIYGPGKLSRPGGLRTHGTMIEAAVAGVPVRVPGGDERDDIIYIDDVAQGIVLAVLTDRAPAPAYNIGTGVGHTLAEFAAAVATVLPNADISIGPEPEAFGIVDHSILDISRAAHDLGYVPRFGLVDGIRDYVDSLQRLGLRPEAPAS